jgi:four helix bundle protein
MNCTTTRVAILVPLTRSPLTAHGSLLTAFACKRPLSFVRYPCKEADVIAIAKPHHRLDAWKEAMGLVSLIYKATQSFPAEERFGLSEQMRRAAVSVASNIAEGAARAGKWEFANFVSIAHGSLSEIETQCLIALIDPYQTARQARCRLESPLALRVRGAGTWSRDPLAGCDRGGDRCARGFPAPHPAPGSHPSASRRKPAPPSAGSGVRDRACNEVMQRSIIRKCAYD